MIFLLLWGICGIFVALVMGSGAENMTNLTSVEWLLVFLLIGPFLWIPFIIGALKR